MTWFVILQILFDAALLAGFLLFFNYAWQKIQRRREDDEVLRNVELQELHAGLQELLVTVRQVGGEVSSRLQEKVKEAEAILEGLESTLTGIRPDLEAVKKLAEEVASEKEHLETKSASLKSTRRLRAAKPKEERTPEAEAQGASRGMEALLPSQAVGFPSSSIKEIYRLADNHLNVGEIARQTQLTRGEVQLILNLRSNRFTTPN